MHQHQTLMHILMMISRELRKLHRSELRTHRRRRRTLTGLRCQTSHHLLQLRSLLRSNQLRRRKIRSGCALAISGDEFTGGFLRVTWADHEA